MRFARITLSALGIGLVAVGAWSALTSLGAAQLVGLAVWLAAAVVVHDGVVGPATAVTSGLVDRVGWRLRAGARAVVRVGLTVAALLCLIAVPAIVAQSLGNPNPTVLPGPHAARLSWVLALIALATVAGVVIAQRRSRDRTA